MTILTPQYDSMVSSSGYKTGILPRQKSNAIYNTLRVRFVL